MFNRKLEEYQRENKNTDFKVINLIDDNTNILSISITFLENVNLNSVIKLLRIFDNNLSYKTVGNRKIIITAVGASPSTSMDIMKNKKNLLEQGTIKSFSYSLNDIGIFKKSFVFITVFSANEELKKNASNLFVGVESIYIYEYI